MAIMKKSKGVVKRGSLLASAKRKVSGGGVKKGTKLKAGALDMASVLKCTEKGVNGSLKVKQRCEACHNRIAKQVINQVTNGEKYRMADLNYDIKFGRLEVLKPGKSAGPPPVGKVRQDAPLAGQPLPNASLTEFMRFLQGQLWMEVKEILKGQELTIREKAANQMLADVDAFATPNLGLTERWVPYHTILGPHELYVVQHIHSITSWTPEQRFIAMFLFRAHCKRDLFTQAQLPKMDKTFWKDPIKAFEPNGVMFKSILQYRKKTGLPLITSCFRIIPKRILKDNDENLVRSITDRSTVLIKVAKLAFQIAMDNKTPADKKLAEISAEITEADGCGDTWAKMLTVCIDLAYPKMRMLESQCDVGVGAVAPLRALLKDASKGKSEGPKEKKAALGELLKVVNKLKTETSRQFWTVLKEAEGMVHKEYKKYPLVLAQATTAPGKLTASTLQVQLCEYRQFRHSIARNKYGLADDETMRAEPEGEGSQGTEDLCEVDTKKNVVWVERRIEGYESAIRFDCPLKSVAGNELVARRVVALCFQCMKEGETKETMLNFKDKLLREYAAGGQDSAPESDSWRKCRVPYSTLKKSAGPVVAFQFEDAKGKSFPLQCTVQAAGGVLNTERISRLCWDMLSAGKSKDEVLVYRGKLYGKIKAGRDGSKAEPPQKKQRRA